MGVRLLKMKNRNVAKSLCRLGVARFGQTAKQGREVKVFSGFVNGSRQTTGISLIELLIVVAIIAVILNLALPVYTNHKTRAKVGEVLFVAAAAKVATAAICVDDPTIDALTNTKAGYGYAASQYVLSVTISGSCSDPVITLQTQNIGVTPDIVVTLKGDLNSSISRMDWVCTSNTSNYNLPKECRI